MTLLYTYFIYIYIFMSGLVAAAGPDSQEEIVFIAIDGSQVAAAAADLQIDAIGNDAANAAYAANTLVRSTPPQVTAEQVKSVYNILKGGVKASLLLVALDAVIAGSNHVRYKIIATTIKAIISLIANTVLASRAIVNAGVSQIDSAIQTTADLIKAGFLALAWGVGEAISMIITQGFADSALTAATSASLYKFADRYKTGEIFQDIANMINRGAIVVHDVATTGGPTSPITAVEAFGENAQPSTYKRIEDIMTRNATDVITLDEYKAMMFGKEDRGFRSVVFNPSCYSQDDTQCGECNYAYEIHRQLLNALNNFELSPVSKSLLDELLGSGTQIDRTTSLPVIGDKTSCKIARLNPPSSSSLPFGGRRTKGRKAYRKSYRKAYKKRTHKRRPRKTHKKMLKRKRRRTRK
jgi:hypothetical protein